MIKIYEDAYFDNLKTSEGLEKCNRLSKKRRNKCQRKNLNIKKIKTTKAYL